MDNSQKWNILFIKQNNSAFQSSSNEFEKFFTKVERVKNLDEAQEALERNQYDILVNDMSDALVEGLILHKKVKEKHPNLCQFALVLPKDADKLFAIADLGVNAFEITPEQFELAMQEIAKFNPYEVTN